MSDLACTVGGEGPPLVVLHGLFGSARNWAGIAKHLGADYRVYALDLPNHGTSPWVGRMDYREMAAMVGAFVDAEGLAAPAILGHSMGGKVAMTLALDDAQRVGALIVADVAPVAYGHTLLHYVEAMQGVDLAGVERRSQVDAQLTPAIAEAPIRAFLLQNLVDDGDGLRWRLNLDVIAADMPAISGFPDFADGVRYDGPTLFVSGALSDYVRPSHGPAMDRLFPGRSEVAMAGVGHWLHAEAPGEFVGHVAGFLAAD